MSGQPPADSSALAERDPRFPSGAWAGFFQQRTDRPTGQDMHFRGGRLTGAGADDCGRFTLAGTYDVARGVAEWTKSYARYAVHYRGFAEDGSLWGVWSLPSGADRGGFRLWPEKSGRRGASRRTRADRPAVVSGDVNAADAFADSLRERLEPAGTP
ncbi:hypothetical protein [Alienimonas sp. DA493]|uniref:hypothetical protein n=1 Tax=Alienimonas sp. DA493 TaxID=3373605 RepID=UPI003754F4DF